MILEAASNLVKLYKTVGRDITNTIIKLDPIIKDFNLEWEILVNRKEEDLLGIPNTSRVLLIIK